MRRCDACVALHEFIPKNQAKAAMAAIVSRLWSSRARVVLVFTVEQDAAALFDEELRHDAFAYRHPIQPHVALESIFFSSISQH